MSSGIRMLNSSMLFWIQECVHGFSVYYSEELEYLQWNGIGLFLGHRVVKYNEKKALSSISILLL